MTIEIDFAKVSPVGVLDIAIAAEQEAEEHYDALVQRMMRQGNGDAAAFFGRMAGLEKLHRDQVAARRLELFGDVAKDLEHRFPWSVEVPEDRASGGELSLRDALEISLAAEARAYDYYDAAIAYVTDDATEKLFVELRDAELGHKRLLQRELDRLA